MKILITNLYGILIIEPCIFCDEKGFFQVSSNKKKFNKTIRRPVKFCQDNHSQSSKGVLRGLHYQHKKSQCKLVRGVEGSVLDVTVGIEKSSPTFGKYFKINLNNFNQKQLWIPIVFANEFLTLTKKVDFLYKANEYYDTSDEECNLWDGTFLNINWELNIQNPNISLKHSTVKLFQNAKVFR